MALCFSVRRALALALVAIILLSCLSISVSAHVSSDTSTTENEVFLLYRSSNGDIACRQATAAERSQLEVSRPQGLRQINHIDETKQTGPGAEALPAHLTIVLRATPNLDANTPAKNAFIRAAAAWENLVSSPVTIYIDVDYGPNNFGQAWPPNVLGSTSSPPSALAIYGAMRNNLIANSNSSTKSAVYAALPPNAVPTDLGSVTTVSIAKALARAIGFADPTAPSTDAAAQIAFNSQLVTYDFDGTLPIVGTDFEAVATHEIGHALGFTSTSGATPIPSLGTVTPAMWDLYRFRSGTTSATFGTAPRIMTIGGPTLNSQYYFVPGATELGLSDGGPAPDKDMNKVAENSDGNQSSHWRQASLNGGVDLGYIGIMDPQIPSGRRRLITANDINAINVLGYNNLGVSQGPPANDNFASAQTLTGCSGSATGTNVFATHEANEPNHFQDNAGINRGGNRSVWYQWQALSSGTATITTAGSGFDTVLAVYTGNSVGALTVVGKNDDSATDVTSNLTFAATAGTVYKIAVDGFNNQSSGGDVGPITINFSLSNCSNSGGPSLQLSAANYSVSEGANFLNVDVVRTGDPSAAVSVNYATSDSAGLTNCTVANGIASERCDYGTTVGTLRFGAGETIKSITIPIINDVLVEGNENFTLTLTSPTGATLGSPQTATVTIVDNDAPTSQNPIDDIPFFVTQQYIDFLGRLPDTIGFANWVATLNGCPDGGFGEFANPDCDRVHVSSGFFLSAEFQGRGYFAYRFYEVALDRRPTYAEFVPDMAIVGGPQSPESEALSKTAYTDAWPQRAEFKARYDGLSNSAYVNALEANAEVTVSNKQALIDALNGGTMNRGQVLRNIVESQAVSDRFFIRAFVAMQYFGYLRRDPDTIGFQNWVNTLTADPSNFRHMIFGFLFSTEYRQRFGP
ncbi:MAG TPA: NF038122 family metalloprotease [Pyrinomonadaceae bacterium]|nr:NF038122 family metalloprotease [Pyrinomonadaceae bacterium]